MDLSLRLISNYNKRYPKHGNTHTVTRHNKGKQPRKGLKTAVEKDKPQNCFFFLKKKRREEKRRKKGEVVHRQHEKEKDSFDFNKKIQFTVVFSISLENNTQL